MLAKVCVRASEVVRAARRAKRAQERAAKELEQRDELIVALHRQGESPKLLAEAVGLSEEPNLQDPPGSTRGAMMAKRSTNLRRRGHIRQRGKSWVVTFRVNGRQAWRSFKTRGTAELYLADTQAAIARREFRVPEKVTLETAALEWLRHGEHERHLKPSTVPDYTSAVNAHLIPAFGQRRLEEVTAHAIEEWRGFEMAEGRLPRRTADKLVAILHGIFERARKAYGFPSNPVDDVERFPAEHSGRFDFLQPRGRLGPRPQGG
jgi:hypothetical protein